MSETLPRRLDELRQSILAGAPVAEAREMAEALHAEGQGALARGSAEAARAAVEALGALERRLDQEYVLRIVSRPGATSGVWRIPDVNEQARNFYLIVEALDDETPVTVNVTSEETGEAELVSQWGMRVPQSTFDAVRRDREDDGIIQDNILGIKRRGSLEPDYTMPVEGGAIIEW
jgi:hypothetical protein